MWYLYLKLITLLTISGISYPCLTNLELRHCHIRFICIWHFIEVEANTQKKKPYRHHRREQTHQIPIANNSNRKFWNCCCCHCSYNGLESVARPFIQFSIALHSNWFSYLLAVFFICSFVRIFCHCVEMPVSVQLRLSTQQQFVTLLRFKQIWNWCSQYISLRNFITVCLPVFVECFALKKSCLSPQMESLARLYRYVASFSIPLFKQ